MVVTKNIDEFTKSGRLNNQYLSFGSPKSVTLFEQIEGEDGSLTFGKTLPVPKVKGVTYTTNTESSANEASGTEFQREVKQTSGELSMTVPFVPDDLRAFITGVGKDEKGLKHWGYGKDKKEVTAITKYEYPNGDFYYAVAYNVTLTLPSVGNESSTGSYSYGELEITGSARVDEVLWIGEEGNTEMIEEFLVTFKSEDEIGIEEQVSEALSRIVRGASDDVEVPSLYVDSILNRHINGEEEPTP